MRVLDKMVRGNDHKMLGVKKIFLLVLAMLVTSTIAQAQSCENLTQYRDNQLYSDFEKSFKRHHAAHESLQLMQELKLENQKIKSQQPTIHAVYQMLLSLKTTADSISAILKINPATKTAMQGIESTNTLSAQIIKASNRIDTMSSILDKDIVNIAIQEVLASQSNLFSVLQSIDQFYQNVSAQKNAYSESQEILNSITTNIQRLDREIAKLNEHLNQANFQIKLLNQIKDDIDQHCS